MRYAATPSGDAYRMDDYVHTESYAFSQSVAGSQSPHMPPSHSELQRSRLEMEQDLLVITMAYQLI